jgi:pilus assembly protein CpaE
MKIVVIATRAHLDTLLDALESSHSEVTHGVLRSRAQPLAEQLPDPPFDLLVVELDPAQSARDLGDLEWVGLRQPGCAIVAVCQGTSPELLRTAMRAGVRELVEWPLAPGALADAVQRLLQRNPATPPRGRLAAFISASGGRGATVLASNVAALLAAENQRNTVYVDLDFRFADATYLLGDHRPGSTVPMLAREVGRLDGQLLQASLVNVAPHLDLLASPGDMGPAESVRPADLEHLLDAVLQDHDCVVVEVDRSLDPVARVALQKASVVFLVADALLPWLRDARHIAQALADLGITEPRLQLVLNRFDRAGDLTPREISSVTGLRPVHTLPARDEELRESLNAGLLLAQWRPSSPLVRALRPLADQVAGAGAPRPAAWFDRLLGRRTAEPEPLAQTLPRPAGAIARRSGADSAGHALPQTRHPG